MGELWRSLVCGGRVVALCLGCALWLWSEVASAGPPTGRLSASRPTSRPSASRGRKARPASRKRALSPSAQKIVAFVCGAQRAGAERHDLKRYMEQWAADARIVGGRLQKAGKYDFVLKRRQIQASKALLYRGPPPKGRKILFSAIRVQHTSKAATLWMTSTIRSARGFERVAERYRLRLTKRGWRVFENRWWPLAYGFGSSTLDYTRAYPGAPGSRRSRVSFWELMDARIRVLRKRGPLRSLMIAYLQGYRFKDAHHVATALCAGKNAQAVDCFNRGNIARIIGKAADAVDAFAKALSLAPRFPLPAYARLAVQAARKPPTSRPASRPASR